MFTIIFLIIFLIVFPCKLYFFCCVSSFYLILYKNLYHPNPNKPDYEIEEDFWLIPTKQIAKVYYFFGCLFYDYETDMNKIPDREGAVIVLYHGLTPCDLGCLLTKVLLEKNRKIYVTVHNGIFKTPGIHTFLIAFGAMNHNREKCAELLKRGELVAMYPGGAEECLLSDDNYTLVWNRKGYARLAYETKSKIIPMFTKNSREIHGHFKIIGENTYIKLYNKFKIPVGLVVWGWFPVKMKTFVADPIEFDENNTVDDLDCLTKNAIKNLIENYQKRPGSIIYAVRERFENIGIKKFT